MVTTDLLRCSAGSHSSFGVVQNIFSKYKETVEERGGKYFPKRLKFLEWNGYSENRDGEEFGPWTSKHMRILDS